jgi:hypothetical protein
MELIIVLVIVALIVVYLVVQRKKDPVTDTTDSNLPVTEPSKEHATNSNVILVTEEKVVVAVPAYEPEGGPLTEKQIEQIKEAAEVPVQSVADPSAPKGKKGRKPRITSDPRDVNHDGVTSEEEKRTWALADARDTNHDGVISAEEKSVAKRNAKAARKPKSQA